MAGLTSLVFAIFTLLINEKPTTPPTLLAADGECTGRHEVFACQCPEDRTCSNWNETINCPSNPDICFPSCACEPGYVYGPDRKCIKPEECPDSGKCPAGEEWTETQAGCEHTCQNPDGPIICPRISVPGCICQEPNVRGPNNKCIPASECSSSNAYPDKRVKAHRGRKIPKDEGSCPAGEEWTETEGHCEHTCQNPDGPLICPRIAIPGCICQAPNVRGPDNKCIPAYECSSSNDEGSCPAGEEWTETEGGCEHTCQNPDGPLICPRIAIPGCICQEPNVRGPNKKCIPAYECPARNAYPDKRVKAHRGRKIPKENEESCPPGETWGCANCQETCDDVGHKICPRMCEEGCVCEYPGQVRGPDNQCIDPPLCPSADVYPGKRAHAQRDRKIPKAKPF